MSSQKVISLTPNFSAQYFISSTTFCGLLLLAPVPAWSQNVQTYGQPLITIMVVAGNLLYWFSTGLYLSIGKRSLAGNGKSSKSLIDWLGAFLTTVLFFLKITPLILSSIAESFKKEFLSKFFNEYFFTIS